MRDRHLEALGESRLRQLQADLRLTPEERVRAAEETALVSLLRAPRARRVIGFERYEDYLEWKRLEDAGDIEVLEAIRRLREAR